MRGRAPRVLLFALVLLVQFVIFEFALRRWGSSEAAPAFQGLFTGDDRIGYRLQPNARAHFATAEFETDIAINNVGVRDSEDLPPKMPGERRVLILGDSLVLSVQVPFNQTFGELLEAQLNASSSARYRVVNAGVQGYGPVEQLLFFRRIVDDVQPDVVLATVFVGNDAEEAVVSEPKLSGKREPAEALRESFVTSLRRTVRRSMVLQLLRLRVVTATDRFQFKAPPEPPLQSYAAQPPPRIPRGIEITRACLQQLRAETEQRGARLAILLMPARFQVDDGDYGRLRQTVKETGGELVRDAATTRFSEGLASVGVPMTDLLPPLRQSLPGPDLFFQQNVHLTPRGHQVVANHLVTFFGTHGF
jgi:lysophospholipase L1-like esterase